MSAVASCYQRDHHLLNEARFRELLDEATVDCYNEDEEFTGVLYALDEHLGSPLQATVTGTPVAVQRLDDQRSSLRRGIVAQVERDGQTYPVGLAELTFADLDAESAEWLAMYRRWLEL